MESHIVDGNNLLEVYHLISELKSFYDRKSSSSFVRVQNIRMRGHEEASGTKYVPQELMDMWAVKDPGEL